MDSELIGVGEYEHIKTNIIGEGNVDADDFEQQYVGCDCPPGGCVSSPVCSCIQLSGEKRHYDDDGRLVESISDSKPIFECSSNCLCQNEDDDGKEKRVASCRNRVVQLGDNPKLELFRHLLADIGRGVRARQRIESGEFVAEYLGEVISCQVAGKRLKPCVDSSVHHYLFTVCEYFNGIVHRTYIDARNFGGIARFINHSCAPNLLPQVVRIGALTPRLALFAARVIEPGDELAYDYGFSDSVSSFKQDAKVDNNDLNSYVAEQKRCQCGAPTCRGFLPSFTGDNL